MKRTYMDLRCDVTRLSQKQRDHLAGHLVAQTEDCDGCGEDDGYPGVEYELDIVENEVEAREVLLHVNVAVPADDQRDAGQIATAIEAALTVGMEGEPSGMFDGVEVCIPLAEEV